MVAKQVADLVTLTRSLLVPLLPWMGLTQGDKALPWIVVLMIANWTADSIDGPIARRSRPYYHTWIGDHDLEIDMSISIGLLFYLMLSGYVKPLVGITYLLFCGLYFLLKGVPRVLAMLFQAPIYVWLTYVAIRDAPASGWWIIGWVLTAIVITWPKFPREIVPEFLHDIGRVIQRYQRPPEKR